MPDDLPVVMADGKQLAQLFENLIGNALKFRSEEPPQIHIGVEHKDRLSQEENAYWVFVAQRQTLEPGLRDLVGYGKPASTPPLVDMWTAWRNVTREADKYLDTLDTDLLTTHFEWKGEPMKESVGTMLQRVIFHYWYHIGESQAVRQLLGHTNLPDFVGDIGGEAPYRPE